MLTMSFTNTLRLFLAVGLFASFSGNFVVAADNDLVKDFSTETPAQQHAQLDLYATVFDLHDAAESEFRL